MRSGETHSQKLRRERQESLRELLSQQKHEQHILDLLKKIENLDEDYNALEIQRLSKVIDTKLALIKKYLPDMKFIEGDLNIESRVITKKLTGVERGNGS